MTMRETGDGPSRRSFLSGLLSGLAAIPFLGGRASRPFRRGRCPVFEPGENRRRIEGFRRACPEVCERLNQVYARVAVRGRDKTGPAILSLSNGDLTPGWTAEDEARWHGAGA